MAASATYTEPPPQLKVIIVGDAAVGKTCLLMRYVKNEFKHQMNMTMGIDFLRTFVDWRGVRVELRIFDTAGQERFGAIRGTAYRGAHGVMLAYSCNNPSSYDRTLSYWLPELVRNCDSSVPCMIVATKTDVPEGERLVTTEQGKQLAQDCTGSIGRCATVQYAETSSLNGDGVKEAFENLVDQMMTHQSSFPPAEETPEERSFKIQPPDVNDTRRKGGCCK